jgi:hypothetical protein
MGQSSSWEANSFSASQEIPRILWKRKVHYHIYTSPPPVSILSQLNPVHTTHPTSWRSILILSPSTASVSQVVSFPQVSIPKPCMHLPHTCHMPRPSRSRIVIIIIIIIIIDIRKVKFTKKLILWWIPYDCGCSRSLELRCSSYASPRITYSLWQQTCRVPVSFHVVTVDRLPGLYQSDNKCSLGDTQCRWCDVADAVRLVSNLTP